MTILIILYLLCGLMYTRRVDLRDKIMTSDDKCILWVLVYGVGMLTGFPEWIHKEWTGRK